jgi:EAL domain-containing protein (putative c-di-GMP-specific phosphodiesterase class I)
MFGNEGNQAIIEATIALGKSFGLKVIADGVESREQELFLRQNGCDEIQGFLYSEPVSAKEITKIVQERNRHKV